MTSPCPFCPHAARDLFGLSLHLEEAHANHKAHVIAAVIRAPLPIVEIDIDEIHFSRIAAAKTAKASA